MNYYGCNCGLCGFGAVLIAGASFALGCGFMFLLLWTVR